MALRTRFFVILFLAGTFFCCACRKSPAGNGTLGQAGVGARPTIVFMTDFGAANDAVAVCKAVIVGIAPDARLMDITHQVTPFQIEEGARFLAGVTPYYPSGTIFLVVVDPGVGTSRKAVIVKSKKGQYFVLPDNGLITPVIERDGLDSAREITNTGWMLQPQVSSTFHGRDLFSPVGAHLARGEDWTKVGPAMAVKDLVRLDLKVAKIDERGLNATVIATDGPFGNLIMNVDESDFFKLGYKFGEEVAVNVAGKEMKMMFVKTFSDVPLKQPLLYIDSRGHLGLAVNQASFEGVYGVKPPAAVFIPRAK